MDAAEVERILNASVSVRLTEEELAELWLRIGYGEESALLLRSLPLQEEEPLWPASEEDVP